MDPKTLKLAYIALAFLVMLGAIVAAYFHEQYVALGLIVLASAIILSGSVLVSYAYKIEKAKGPKKL
jgi:uncharacterized membrane-anchored protein